MVASLATARVFVPIVAQLAEEGEGATGVHGDQLHSDKQADMALVTLKAPDGRTAMPVFTSAASLEAWHPEARPVAVYAARAALSAVAEGAELLVLDPGSDVDVRGAPAGGLGPRPAADVDAFLRRSGAGGGPSGRARLAFRRSAVLNFIRAVELPRQRPMAAGSPVAEPGPELRVVLYLEDGLDAAGVQSIVAGLNNAWARNEFFAERVDSIEVKLQRAAP